MLLSYRETPQYKRPAQPLSGLIKAHQQSEDRGRNAKVRKGKVRMTKHYKNIHKPCVFSAQFQQAFCLLNECCIWDGTIRHGWGRTGRSLLMLRCVLLCKSANSRTIEGFHAMSRSRENRGPHQRKSRLTCHLYSKVKLETVFFLTYFILHQERSFCLECFCTGFLPHTEDLLKVNLWF